MAMLASGARAASTTNVIYSFAGGADGEYTDTDLVIDSAGNLYGTSVLGGDFGGGTVFQLTPSGDSWIHTVLYSFSGGADGGEPYKGVTLDTEGNLYGTAVTGGAGSCEGGCGVAYKLTNSAGTWTQTVIHAFTGGDDGSGPGAGLTIDKRGNLYGMAPTGGANGLGVVYQLHPDQSGNWTLKVIHTFTGGTDGATGSAGRMLLRGGHLYGAATAGGANGKGTAFELTPTPSGEWATRRAISMAPPTTTGHTTLAPFTRWLPGPRANGKKESFTASKAEQTEPIPSATWFLTRRAISMERRVKAAWGVARSSS
ncbi:MAG: hypothetical protein DME36_10760 [Verrucomicrobia bacterium]|nr:MAG: hypothetical protein DME36_10760 [Verrucomicrobiota bacterium]